MSCFQAVYVLPVRQYIGLNACMKAIIEVIKPGGTFTHARAITREIDSGKKIKTIVIRLSIGQPKAA